jgi:hypothetical protein
MKRPSKPKQDDRYIKLKLWEAKLGIARQCAVFLFQVISHWFKN